LLFLTHRRRGTSRPLIPSESLTEEEEGSELVLAWRWGSKQAVKRREDNWIDADLLETGSNIDFLGRQPPVADGRFF
jgi:hypothetical protein